MEHFMKAKKVIISAKGDVNAVKVVEYDVLEPKENEVRVKVAFAGLAYADIMLRRMKIPGLPKPPFTPGADISGKIDKIGKGVKDFKPGDRVLALLMSDFGGQKQYVNINEDRVLMVPHDIPLDKVVCMVVNYLTAYKMLFRYLDLLKIDNPSILVHGGSGGVGSGLIQLAVSHNIKVFTTVSRKNYEFVSHLGAIPIDYTNSDFVTEKELNDSNVHMVFDPIGGDYLKKSLKVLKKGGYYIGYGFHNKIDSGYFEIIKTILYVIFKVLTTFSVKIKSFQLRDKSPSSYMKDLQTLFKMYQNKQIDPTISEIIPIEKAQEAHRKLENGNRKGKILIRT